MSVKGRFKFLPQRGENAGRVDVLGPDGIAICWLPEAVAASAEGVYRKACEADFVVANEFMRGFLFGLHLALAFGNQIPTIDVTSENGLLSFVMVDDAVAEARRAR